MNFPISATNQSQRLELARNKYELIAKIAITIVAILGIAPFIFMLIKGIIGVIAAVAIVAIVIAIAPAVSLAIANLGVSLLKLEAGRNPVETLQNEYRQRKIQLEAKKQNIETCIAKVKTFETKVETLKLKYPQEATNFSQQIQTLDDLLEIRKEKYKAAAKALHEFKEVVEKADAIWQVTQALGDVTSDGDKEEEFYSELRTKTALDSVQESLAHSFSALETSLLEASTEQQILAGNKS